MSVNPNRAFEVDAIIINETVGIFGGAEDPSSAGQAGPIGSIYLRTNGDIWQKTGETTTDWEVNQKGAGSQAAANAYDGQINVSAASYSASNKVVILINTTQNAVEIILPNAAAYTNKIFHVKWIAGTNTATLTAQSGQSIDGESSHIYGELMDSLELISDGINWYII